MILPAATSLAGYTLWLLAFPMSGFLLAGEGGEPALLYFLVPHIGSLLATSRVPGPTFRRWAPVSGALAVLATALFPLWPGQAAPLLVACGLLSGPVAVQAGVILSGAEDPPLQAAWALVGANVLLALLGLWPPARPLGFALAALALSVPCFMPTRAPAPGAAHPAPGRGRALLRYLPFIFVFHLVSGLFYGSLMPAYDKVRFLPAADLLFYIGAVLLTLRPLRRSSGAALTCAILLSMLSLGVFQADTVLAVHVSMFAMQAAAGFMDVFVLLFLLRQADPIRAFGAGLATLCLGILAGKAVSLAAGGASGVVAVVGSMALNLALLSLYWSGRRTGEAPRASAEAAEPVRAIPPEASYRLPPGLNARLSNMERAVLEMVLEGRTFKEAAAALAVSESSVKTYMKRIYEKAEVPGKGALLEKLARSAAAAPPPSGPSPVSPLPQGK